MTRSETVVNPDVQASDETAHLDHAQEVEAEGFTFTREDGTVEHARTREEVLAVCPVMGKLAVDAPEKADLLFDMAAVGSQQLANEARTKTDKPARENNNSDLFKKNAETPATQSNDTPRFTKLTEEAADIHSIAPQTQAEHSHVPETVGIVTEAVGTRENAATTSDDAASAGADAPHESEPSRDASSLQFVSERKDINIVSTKIQKEASSPPIHQENSRASRRESSSAEEKKTLSIPVDKGDKPIIITPEPQSPLDKLSEPSHTVPTEAASDYLGMPAENPVQQNSSTHRLEASTPPDTDETTEAWRDGEVQSEYSQDEVAAFHQVTESDEALPTDASLVDYANLEHLELSPAESTYDVVEVYADLAHLISMQNELEAERDKLVTEPLTHMDAEERLQFEQGNSAELTVDNRFTEYIQEVYVSEVEEEPLTIESLREVADEQPPEDTLACLAKIIENTDEEYVVPEGLTQALDDIDALLQEHYRVTNEEGSVIIQRTQPELTLELTEKLLGLFQELGYSQPDEALRELVRRFGYNFLLEAFEHMYKLRQNGQRKEFLLNVPSSASPSTQFSPLRERVGKLIFAVIVRSSPQAAATT